MRGSVVDSDSKLAADVDVTVTWRANGSPYDENGRLYDLKTVQGQKAFRGNVGAMFPLGEKPVETARDGRFAMCISDDRHHLMAMDQARHKGALAILALAEKAEVELRLAPLTRVKGDLEGPGEGEKPEWSHVYTLVPDNPTGPLDFTRLPESGKVISATPAGPEPNDFATTACLADFHVCHSDVVPVTHAIGALVQQFRRLPSHHPEWSLRPEQLPFVPSYDVLTRRSPSSLQQAVRSTKEFLSAKRHMCPLLEIGKPPFILRIETADDCRGGAIGHA